MLPICLHFSLTFWQVDINPSSYNISTTQNTFTTMTSTQYPIFIQNWSTTSKKEIQIAYVLLSTIHDEKADLTEIFWKYQLELLKIHIKSVKISRFSPKYWAIFSFVSQVCCLISTNAQINHQFLSLKCTNWKRIWFWLCLSFN